KGLVTTKKYKGNGIFHKRSIRIRVFPRDFTHIRSIFAGQTLHQLRTTRDPASSPAGKVVTPVMLLSLLLFGAGWPPWQRNGLGLRIPATPGSPARAASRMDSAG